jgi:mannose-6-phosphate isomerase-like protein (cupin superfamily)
VSHIQAHTPVVTGKLWGAELDIVTNEYYTGKFLMVQPGYMSSIHRHPVKTETFYVDAGIVRLRFYDEAGRLCSDVVDITQGQAVTIPAMQYHSFMAVGVPARVIEFSTPHSDNDVERAEVSKSLRGMEL